MESRALNSSPGSEAKLEELLRTAALPPIADDGFSVRVAAALPPRRALRHLWLIPVLGAAIGLAFALGDGASIPDPAALWDRLAAALDTSTAMYCALAAAAFLAFHSLSGDSLV